MFKLKIVDTELRQDQNNSFYLWVRFQIIGEGKKDEFRELAFAADYSLEKVKKELKKWIDLYNQEVESAKEQGKIDQLSENANTIANMIGETL